MLSLRNVVFRHPGASALTFSDLELGPGEHALLVGPSGSGKSTLLHLAAGLLTPAHGEIRLGGVDIAALRGASRDHFRGRNVGIVFQRLHLIPSLTVTENLLVAQFCAGLPQDRQVIASLLSATALGEKSNAYPAALSQGQAQRVAIARALVNRPQLIVADEPTSSLDDRNASAVLTLLTEQARQHGAMLLIATHDARARALVPRQIEVGLSAELAA